MFFFKTEDNEFFKDGNLVTPCEIRLEIPLNNSTTPPVGNVEQKSKVIRSLIK